MIYIVSGFMRSGTSMMMRALEVGGLEAVYSVERDARMNAKWGAPDYVPNERYYELDADEYRSSGFPSQYEGRLLKCLWGGMLRLPPVAQYRIVFMRRDVQAIRRSLTAFFGQPTKSAQRADLADTLDVVEAILRDRRSVASVTTVQYADVVADPIRAFETIQADGWPIDVSAAAAVPDARNNRYGSVIEHA